MSISSYLYIARHRTGAFYSSLYPGHVSIDRGTGPDLYRPIGHFGCIVPNRGRGDDKYLVIEYVARTVELHRFDIQHRRGKRADNNLHLS